MTRLALTTLTLAAAVALATGCATPANKPQAKNTLTEITPAQASVTPAPAPLAATPVIDQAPVIDTTPAVVTVSPAARPAASKKYTVRKGDTLWAIAKTSYGDGKQFPKIVSANPGLSAQTLKAGQTLVIP